MFSVLMLLFVTVPILEVWILLTVGGLIGAVPTIGIILATGALGAAMARREGLKALARVQEALAQGRMPGREIVSGLLVLVGGLLLLTPGMLTDLLGFACLLPPTRELIAAVVQRQLAGQIQGSVSFGQPTIIDVEDLGRSPGASPRGEDEPRRSNTIDVTGRELP